MSDSFFKGRSGASYDEEDDLASFNRGREDAGLPTVSYHTWQDLPGVRKASRQTAIAWQANPDRTLKILLAQILGFSVLGAVLGYLAGNLLQNNGLWLSYAKVFFFFAIIANVPPIVGVTIRGRGTARGCLTIVFMGGMAVWMAWTYALYPAIFSHIH